MRTLIRSFAISVAGTCACATFALGQGNPTGNSSDVSGPPVTSGDVAGGAFTPGPTSGGTTATLASPGAQAAVVAQTSVVSSSLSAGNLTSISGAAIPAALQTQLLGVLTSNSPTTGAAAQISEALGGAGAAASAALPGLLLSLSGLAANPAQLPSAIGSYNAFVSAASAEFLASAPPALLAIQSVLSQLSTAASSVK